MMKLVEKLKECLAYVKNRFVNYPKMFRSDNGGEHIGKSVQDVLKVHGISVQNTVLYSPQQNGVEDRKNRTLCEAAICMLIDAELLNKYRGEVVVTANCL
ncbi:hypothetical protein JTB14_018905 [Gonioctena quinquepunctata]|nr:hypothetical protein JTB14_018905 [Gonioctena quinquepunctata]